MKPFKKPSVTSSQQRQSTSNDRTTSVKVHLTVVSEKERELYRVPFYEYLLP